MWKKNSRGTWNSDLSATTPPRLLSCSHNISNSDAITHPGSPPDKFSGTAMSRLIRSQWKICQRMHTLHRGYRVVLHGTVIRRERMTERPWMARACPMQYDPIPSRTHSRPKYLLRGKKCFFRWQGGNQHHRRIRSDPSQEQNQPIYDADF